MEAATYLTPAELVERYRGRITAKTLANWRWLGQGPRATKIGGRILYALADVLNWEAQQRPPATEKAVG